MTWMSGAPGALEWHPGPGAEELVRRRAQLHRHGDAARLADAYLVPGAGRFIAAVLGMAMAVAAARFLYRRKIFLRV